MRTLSSLQRRKVVTESGDSLGRLYDLRGELSPRKLEVSGLVVGGRGFLEHLGVVKRRECIPWDDVVRIEGKRIVVRDQ
ncbi:MAG: PRC-barrel domain [Gaiellaceae bacterium]|nr:PRC-barrel domain [Gaiellaceae bacterium]